MSHLFREIYDGIENFIVQKVEDFGYCRNQILKDTPYLLCDRELNCISGYFPKEATDGFVVAEAFGNRKDVVLKTTQCRSSNLRRKTSALAFAEAEIGLAILEHDFKNPSARIYFPSLKEAKICADCKQTVPIGTPPTTGTRSSVC